MKCFVTGANGFIGFELVKELIKQGYEVNVLVRRDFPELPGGKINVFKGDLNDVEIIDQGMNGCEYVFHLAAYANLWSKDKTLPYRTNVEGTRNVLKLALKNKVKKMVFTSSAATLPPSYNLELVDETFHTPEEYTTDYEITKNQAEQLCIDYHKKGLNVVIVNPSRVYGPGHLNKSNSVTILFKKYLEGKWRFIPGNGESIGNYVFIGDIIQGHIKAIEKGKSGEKYILGGVNVSFNELFNTLKIVSGIDNRLFRIPVNIMSIIALISVFLADTFNIKPLITPVWLKRYLQNRLISSKKAGEQLDYNITPLEKGIEETITWLKSYESKPEKY